MWSVIVELEEGGRVRGRREEGRGRLGRVSTEKKRRTKSLIRKRTHSAVDPPETQRAKARALSTKATTQNDGVPVL